MKLFVMMNGLRSDNIKKPANIALTGFLLF